MIKEGGGGGGGATFVTLFGSLGNKTVLKGVKKLFIPDRCSQHIKAEYFVHVTSTSYTKVCLSVRGDKPQALTSGLSPIQADKPWNNYLIPPSPSSV